jgi:hypothetical protein
MKKLTYRLGVIGLLIPLSLFFISPLPTRSHGSPPIQTIESDDPRVLQSGTWSSQNTTLASNGSYLYNDPSPVGAGLSPAQDDPLLALAFVGSAIEIIYVAGPQFGTLAIEIDGTVLRTVITTSPKIEYGQTAKVDYLFPIRRHYRRRRLPHLSPLHSWRRVGGEVRFGDGASG